MTKLSEMQKEVVRDMRGGALLRKDLDKHYALLIRGNGMTSKVIKSVIDVLIKNGFISQYMIHGKSKYYELTDLGKTIDIN
jgi:predicted transcriptional regulator